MNGRLQHVVDRLQSQDSGGSIPVGLVRDWMTDENTEVLGAVFTLLHREEHYRRINPPLTFTDYHQFHLNYYERCLRENPDGEWADSRYTAAHSLVAWFRGLWKDDTVPREALVEVKEVLGTLYRGGDASVRTCIITGVLEHLLTDRSIRGFFRDWEADDLLKQAFADGVSMLGISSE